MNTTPSSVPTSAAVPGAGAATSPGVVAPEGDRQTLPPVGTARRLLAGFAIVATLPYLALKVAWLSGSRIGLVDPDFGDGTAMQVLNSLTLALDVVALLLAIVFLTRRGLRAPAWLVLPPMWIGAGLLGLILITTPLSLIQAMVAPSQPPTAELPPLADWVYPTVYSGFCALGIGLLGAFALYARQRWGSRVLPRPTPRARRLLPGASAVVLAAGLVSLWLADMPLANRLLDLAVAGTVAAALLTLRRPLRGTASRVAVVFAFISTGALVAWSTYLCVLTVLPNDLVGQTVIDWRSAGVAAGRSLSGFLAVGALAARLRGR